MVLAEQCADLCTGGISILQDYPWTRYRCYVDVAGAYGSFMADLLAMNPQSIGVLFDQPHVRCIGTAFSSLSVST